MDSSQSLSREEQILYGQLPELAWRNVFKNLGADFIALESCAEASNVLKSLVFGNGQVSLGIDKILPSVFRNWVDRSDKGTTSKNEPMQLLLSLVDLKPRITVLEVFVDRDFRPSDELLNYFLKLQRDHLEIFHVSCVDLESNPVVLDLAGMTRVRELKIMRSVGKEPREFKWDLPRSLYFNFPEHGSLPALEKLTLSLGFNDNWRDFFKREKCHEIGFGPRFLLTPVKHMRFVDFTTAKTTTICKLQSGWAVDDAFLAFPNLVSLEIPAMELKRISHIYRIADNLKRLTITLPRSDRHRHVMDMCITGYGKEVCAALFADPSRDPVQVREEIEEELALKIDYLDEDSDRVRLDIRLRRVGLRLFNLTVFENLEVLKIKSYSAEWAPTVVSVSDILNMKSLKVLDFDGEKPMHIPDKVIQKMRKRFTVLCE